MTKRAATGPSIDAACLGIAQASPSAGRKATRSPPENSIRPASSSSISATRTSRAGASAARASSSSVIGEGPSSAAMRSRTPFGPAARRIRRLSRSSPGARGSPRCHAHHSPPARLALAALFQRREQIVRAHRRKRRQDVVDMGADRRALFQEIVGSFRAGIERRPRRGEHLAVLFEREFGGDERTGAPRRLDHDRPEREAGDDAVAPRKVASARLPFDRHFRHHCAIFDHPLDQGRRFARIGFCVSSGEHPDRAGLEARRVRALVDPARQPRGDDIARAAEPAREPLGEGEPGRRRVARPYDRDRRLLQRLWPAAAGEDRRRRIDLAQDRRIVRLADRDEPHAEPPRRSEARARFPRPRRPGPGARAPPRRASSGSASIAARAPPHDHERAKGARADVLGADQPQPVDKLTVGETRLRLAPS